MKKGVSESEFYMYRTLFALAYADDVLSQSELTFTAEILEDIPFSAEQAGVLREDIHTPKNVQSMFDKITDQADQAKFFDLARKLVWADGDYGEDEKSVMLKLISKHIKNVNVDDLVGKVEMELEDDGGMFEVPKVRPAKEENPVKSALFSFRERFLGKRFKDE